MQVLAFIFQLELWDVNIPYVSCTAQTDRSLWCLFNSINYTSMSAIICVFVVSWCVPLLIYFCYNLAFQNSAICRLMVIYEYIFCYCSIASIVVVFVFLMTSTILFLFLAWSFFFSLFFRFWLFRFLSNKSILLEKHTYMLTTSC